jgi:hypothetical protein
VRCRIVKERPESHGPAVLLVTPSPLRSGPHPLGYAPIIKPRAYIASFGALFFDVFQIDVSPLLTTTYGGRGQARPALNPYGARA